MRKPWSLRWALLLGLLMALSPSLLAQEVGKTVVKQGVIAGDLYVAGGRVALLADVDGDVIAAGGHVSIDQLVKGDVIVAGGLVDVRGQVLDDVRAAGGSVTIDGWIGGDTIAAGGSVSLAPETRVSGRAWLAGGNVEVAGSIGKELKAAAGTISLSGQVQGDVDLVAREVEILPTARISGNLTYRSPQTARIDQAAQIGGTVTHLRYEMPERATRTIRAIFGVFRVMFFLGLIVAGIVLFLLLPNFTVSAARTIRSDPWKSLGLGFALLVATPIAGVLLMITILGVPLALTLFALYFVSLLLGFLTAAFFVGDLGGRLLRREPELSKGWRILSLIVALIVLALLRLIPIAGGLILFLALLFGLGAWSLHLYRSYAGARS